MKAKKEDLEMAVKLLSEDALLGVFLRSASPCGVTTRELVVFMADLDSINSSARAMRKVLAKLSNLGDYGLPIFFEERRLSIKGRAGSKSVTYLLTDFGSQVLHYAHPEITVRKLEHKGMVDILHRFCQLEVYILAVKQGWSAEVEKVLPYGTNRSVRADLAIATPNGPLYVEIEQRLEHRNRATEKFEHWSQYHAETGEMPNIVFLFNLKENDKGGTLSYWRDALWEIKPPFGVKYMLMQSLREKANLDADLANAMELKPVPMSEKKLDTSSWELPIGIKDDSFLEELRDFVSMQEMYREKLLAIKARRAFAPPELEYESLKALITSCEFIWSIDHKPPREELGDPAKIMDIPENSLGMLRYYLMHLPDLHQAIRDATPKKGLAITQQRMGMNAVVLAFLRYWRIWPTNEFSFRVDIPDHGDSDFMPRVKVLGNYQIQEGKKIGIEWVLTMLIAFPEEFGLS
jgi:hypothetical protein